MWERCNRRSNKCRSETLFLIDVAEVARPRAMIMNEQPLRRHLARSEDLLKRIKIARFVIARPVTAGTGGKPFCCDIHDFDCPVLKCATARYWALVRHARPATAQRLTFFDQPIITQ